MLTLIFILLVTMVSLTVILWAGSFFLQGYVYTEANPGIYWQAPAAAALLTVGFTVWSMSIALSSTASTTNMPTKSLLFFSASVDMFERPAKTIWAIKRAPRKDATEKDGEIVAYVSERRGQTQYSYKSAIKPSEGFPTNLDDIIAIKIQKPDKTEMRFDRLKAGPGQYPQFANGDWIIKVTQDGPTGNPERTSYGLIFWNLFFNIGHLIGWFIGLWLLLRFQWSYALGLTVVMWAAATFLFVPMLLFTSAEVAEARRAPAATAPR